MKVDGASQQNISYSHSKPIETADHHSAIDRERTNSLEIINYTKLNLGYQPTIQEKLIIDSIEKANQKILGPEREFEFAIHKKTKQIMVKVIDKGTKEIIREIPPEKVLDAVAHMCEVAGIFMDEKR